MKKTITIEVDKIITGIIEKDESVHELLKKRVYEKIVEDLVYEIKAEFFNQDWRGKEDVKRSVMDEIEEAQTRFVKEILKEFYDSYRRKGKDLSILKKLKEFINEQD